MKKVILALLSVALLAGALPAIGQARPGTVWRGGELLFPVIKSRI
jgi:hypothetical protein